MNESKYIDVFDCPKSLPYTEYVAMVEARKRVASRFYVPTGRIVSLRGAKRNDN